MMRKFLQLVLTISFFFWFPGFLAAIAFIVLAIQLQPAVDSPVGKAYRFLRESIIRNGCWIGWAAIGLGSITLVFGGITEGLFALFGASVGFSLWWCIKTIAIGAAITFFASNLQKAMVVSTTVAPPLLTAYQQKLKEERYKLQNPLDFHESEVAEAQTFLDAHEIRLTESKLAPNR